MPRKSLLFLICLISYVAVYPQLTDQKMYKSLLYGTYLGGEGIDEAWPKPEVLLGPDGTLYLAGLTKSEDFLVNEAVINRFTANRYNLFVCHIHPDSSSILAGAVLGPVAGFRGVALEKDLQGNILLGGFSTGQGFNSHGSGYLSQPNGGTDAILYKLNPGLTEVIKQTCFGGSGDDELYGISMIGDFLYLIGTTKSSDLPVHDNAFQENFRGVANGEPDLYVARFDSDFNLLLGCTYLGGSGLEAGYLSKNQDAVLIAGFTGSNDYPVSNNAYDTSFNGFFDVILTRLSDDLSRLEASTYVGGSGGDFGYDCAVKDNAIYVTGHGARGFPVTQGAYDRSYNGGPGGYDDVIVAKLNWELSALEAATFIGGNQFDNGIQLLIDDAGDVVIGGYTYSSNFPVIRNGWDQVFGGESDIFITTFKPDLSDLTFSSFIGGDGEDREVFIAITQDEQLLIAAETESTDLTISGNCLQDSLSGSSDLSLFISGEDPDLSFVEYQKDFEHDLKIHYQDRELRFQFNLQQADLVQMELYDIRGRVVYSSNEYIPSMGTITRTIRPGRALRPGVYLGLLRGSDFSATVKIRI